MADVGGQEAIRAKYRRALVYLDLGVPEHWSTSGGRDDLEAQVETMMGERNGTGVGPGGATLQAMAVKTWRPGTDPSAEDILDKMRNDYTPNPNRLVIGSDWARVIRAKWAHLKHLYDRYEAGQTDVDLAIAVHERSLLNAFGAAVGLPALAETTPPPETAHATVQHHYAHTTSTLHGRSVPSFNLYPSAEERKTWEPTPVEATQPVMASGSTGQVGDMHEPPPYPKTSLEFVDFCCLAGKENAPAPCPWHGKQMP